MTNKVVYSAAIAVTVVIIAATVYGLLDQWAFASGAVVGAALVLFVVGAAALWEAK